jgi:hypothetical protein
MQQHARHQGDDQPRALTVRRASQVGRGEAERSLYNRRWTDEEDDFVMCHHETMSDTDMAAALSRTPNGIEVRRSRDLNLLKNTRSPDWTEEEEAMVQALYGKVDSGFLAAVLCRSTKALTARAHVLGVHGRKRWSKDEDDILRKHYPYVPVRRFAHLLPDRNLPIIYHRALRLSLTHAPSYMAKAPHARFHTYPPELQELIRLHKKVERKLRDVQTQYRKHEGSPVQGA